MISFRALKGDGNTSYYLPPKHKHAFNGLTDRIKNA